MNELEALNTLAANDPDQDMHCVQLLEWFDYRCGWAPAVVPCTAVYCCTCCRPTCLQFLARHACLNA
jgi:hypothetical protein